MGEAELNGKYRRLRTELDAAYASPEWDAGGIDRLADEISRGCSECWPAGRRNHLRDLDRPEGRPTA